MRERLGSFVDPLDLKFTLGANVMLGWQDKQGAAKLKSIFYSENSTNGELSRSFATVPRAAELNVGKMEARGRLLVVLGAWGLALLLAYAGTASPGLSSIVLLPGFPAGLVFLLPLRHLSDDALTLIVICLWIFYVAISRAVVTARNQKHVVALGSVLGLALVLNVAGCSRPPMVWAKLAIEINPRRR